jgi:hypothetical protein
MSKMKKRRFEFHQLHHFFPRMGNRAGFFIGDSFIAACRAIKFQSLPSRTPWLSSAHPSADTEREHALPLCSLA